ncbi:MAG: hypothetical protein IPM38_13970, partial [Ignavibacteria bacterium]|nr:hypothetical protein [Ignavibacteria bacterium]
MEKLIYSIIIVLIVHCTLNIDNCEAQWKQTPGIPEGSGITDMVIAENGNIVVTTASFNWPNGQDGGVRWSSDEGVTWNSPFNYFNARTLALGQNGWIFCSAWDFPATERLYASSDNGQTWPMSLYTVG